MDFEAVAFVTFVTLLITTITALYLVLYMGPLLHQNAPVFWILAPIFTIIDLLMMVSYFRAVCSSPGHPNRRINREFRVEQIQLFKEKAVMQRNKKKQRRTRARINADPEQIREMAEITYCERCDLVKRPRVHHCKICDECILRMDHHCPWVGNCVGKNNHKYFILFLLYATLGLGIVWISIAVDAFSDWHYVSKTDSEVAVTLAAVAGIGSLILFLSIGGLLISQLWATGGNMTTLESFVPGFDDRNPFDKGSWSENFAEIFGPDYWWLPVRPNLECERDDLGRGRDGLRDQLVYKPPQVYSNKITSE